MLEFLNSFMPNVIELFPDMIKALGETLLMVFISGGISTLIGIPIGVVLVVTRPGDILENKAVYSTVGKVINVFRSIPFVARQIESALLDIDKGVIEAAQAMGSSPIEIIYRVLLKEGLPGIVYTLTISTVSLISFSAVAGTVGGGGLGDFSIRYGYQYFKTNIIIARIIILLILVNPIQGVGEFLLRRLSH